MGNASLVEIVYSVTCVVSAGVLTQKLAVAKERNGSLGTGFLKNRHIHYCDQVVIVDWSCEIVGHHVLGLGILLY